MILPWDFLYLVEYRLPNNLVKWLGNISGIENAEKKLKLLNTLNFQAVRKDRCESLGRCQPGGSAEEPGLNNTVEIPCLQC